MNILDVRNHLKKVTLTKDASLIKGDTVIPFVSWPQLRKALDESLPEGITHESKVEFDHLPVPFNYLTLSVKFDGELIHIEKMAMPLYDNPLDAAGALTLLKKALYMSAFDLIPDEGVTEKLDLDPPALKALVQMANEIGAPTAIHEGNKKYNMTDAAIKTIREAVAKKQEAAKAERMAALPAAPKQTTSKTTKTEKDGAPTDGPVV